MIEGTDNRTGRVPNLETITLIIDTGTNVNKKPITTIIRQDRCI